MAERTEPGSIATYRNTTEAQNAVMYSLLTEFRDGDNIVTTMMEHIELHSLERSFAEIMPASAGTWNAGGPLRPRHRQLDLEHLASLVDSRTKLVCCTGRRISSGTRPPLAAIRMIADGSGYQQPNGECRSRLLVDGAQLVPSSRVDVQQLDVDYLSFSFHKFMAPFGVGVLYAKEHLLGAVAAVPVRRGHGRRGTGV